MFLLDTDILTLIEKEHPRTVQRLLQVNPAEVATSLVTAIELLRGRFDAILKAASAAELLRAQDRMELTRDLLNEINVRPITERAAAEFERLVATKKLKKIGRADLLIASIALANDATLVTRNLRHFRQVPDLALENWAD